jgi:dihydrofolate reductase
MSEAARVIGFAGDMPWKLRTDLQRFKRITVGHPIIMGRKTHQLIGRALPSRTNLVLSRDPSYEAPGCTVYSSLETAIASAPRDVETFVIGGSEVFKEALPLADRLYVTWVDYHGPGDTFFPEDPWWRFLPRAPDPGIEAHDVDEHHTHPTRYMVMTRRAEDR